MFEGVDTLPWSEFWHSYGPAEEVPHWLRQIASNDAEVQSKGIWSIYSHLCDQGSVSPVTVYAIPYLLELLCLPTVQVKKNILEFLADVALCWPDRAEEWVADPESSTWKLPANLPLKNAREEIRKGTSIFRDLLADSSAEIRMVAAQVLVLVAEPSEELRLRFLQALQSESEREARANFALALGAVSLPNVSTHWQPFMEIVEAEEDVLPTFCAALMLSRLAREETPQEVVQLLADIVFPPVVPERELYWDLPCAQEINGGLPTWRAAALALLYIEPERLSFMSQALQDAFADKDEGWSTLPTDEHMDAANETIQARFGAGLSYPRRLYNPLRLYTLTELLLHIFFARNKPGSEGQSLAADELTAQQRTILLLFCTRPDPWDNCAGMLKAYGLPYSWKMTTIFLKRDDLSSPFTYKPEPSMAQRIRSLSPSMTSDVKWDVVNMKARDEELLDVLQKRLPLPITETIASFAVDQFLERYASFEEEMRYEPVGLVSYSNNMGGLGGRPFTKERLEHIDDQALIDTLALEIGSFLHALHHIPPSIVADFKLPLRHNREVYATLYARAREALFLTMSEEERQQIITSFETFLNTPGNFSLEPVIIHGYFDSNIIFYNLRRHAISHIGGRWSSMQSYPHIGLGDPARDFASMLGSEGYSEDFVRRCEPAYPELASFWGRVPFHIQAFKVQEALKRHEEKNAPGRIKLEVRSRRRYSKDLQ